MESYGFSQAFDSYFLLIEYLMNLWESFLICLSGQGGIVCIEVMVVQVPLDINFLLKHDYVYAMEVLMEVMVSIIFQVMHFLHDGEIFTID